jgi:DNA-3-methyladenine glycosylase
MIKKFTVSKSLDKSFYQRPALKVASDLIGCVLVFNHPESGQVAGVIVETEAYTSGDEACHAWHLEKKRLINRDVMGRGHELFGRAGLTYVYLNYGMYWLLNVVTDEEGVPGAVLIRAVEPILNERVCWKNRPGVKSKFNLTNGPGKLTLAMGIEGSHHQLDITKGPIFIVPRPQEILEIASSSRIGISKATEHQWRFFLGGNPYVSPGKPSDRVARPNSTILTNT